MYIASVLLILFLTNYRLIAGRKAKREAARVAVRPAPRAETVVTAPVTPASTADSALEASTD
jgi:hypothetical protein